MGVPTREFVTLLHGMERRIPLKRSGCDMVGCVGCPVGALAWEASCVCESEHGGVCAAGSGIVADVSVDWRHAAGAVVPSLAAASQISCI